MLRFSQSRGWEAESIPQANLSIFLLEDKMSQTMTETRAKIETLIENNHLPEQKRTPDSRVAVSKDDRVSVFDNPEFGKIRAILRDGEPWFVGNDVCACLELVNARDALSKLDPEDKRSVGSTDSFIDSDGLRSDSRLVNEAGLYDLVMMSKKPEARAFRRWVTHEVLPTIRKTGGYGQTPSLTEERVIKIMELMMEPIIRKTLDGMTEMLVSPAAIMPTNSELVSIDRFAVLLKVRPCVVEEALILLDYIIRHPDRPQLTTQGRKAGGRWRDFGYSKVSTSWHVAFPYRTIKDIRFIIKLYDLDEEGMVEETKAAW